MRSSGIRHIHMSLLCRLAKGLMKDCSSSMLFYHWWNEKKRLQSAHAHARPWLMNVAPGSGRKFGPHTPTFKVRFVCGRKLFEHALKTIVYSQGRHEWRVSVEQRQLLFNFPPEKAAKCSADLSTFHAKRWTHSDMNNARRRSELLPLSSQLARHLS